MTTADPPQTLKSSTLPISFSGTTTESTFTTSTQLLSLYTKTWTPANPSSTHLIFLHGFSDHINAYYNLFPILASAPYNITVHGYDQRGWGRSAPDKKSWGLTGSTDLVISDIHDFIGHVISQVQSTPNVKMFLAGHSMGGAETLTCLLHQPSLLQGLSVPISGAILEAPHILLPAASQPSKLLEISGRIAGRLLPNMQMVQQLDPSFVSRDPLVVEQWKADPLCHDTGTLAGLAGLLDRAGHLNEMGLSSTGAWRNKYSLADQIPCPVFWTHGSGDLICDFEASKRLYERLVGGNAGLNEFKEYSGAYHKLHCEPNGDGETFGRDVGDWILKIAGPDSQARSKL